MLDRKRNKKAKPKPIAGETRQIDDRTGKGVATQERLPRGRRPETLQTFKRAALQPWIDFANLLPFNSLGSRWRSDEANLILSDEFVRKFGQHRRPHPFHHLVQRVTHWGTSDPKFNRELTNLFKSVLSVFERLPDMTRPSRMKEDEPAWVEHYDSVPFNMTYFIEDNDNGRVRFAPDPLLAEFKKALEGTEISRMRRCPICGNFYYAVRDNKGACDKHLARARVERGRDPELRKKYEKNRKRDRAAKVAKAAGKFLDGKNLKESDG